MCLCWVDFVLLPSKRFFAMWCHAGLLAADEAAGEVLEHSAWAWRKPWRKCQAVPSLKRAPENRPKPKREVVFQSSIFRCYVSFREISGRVESRFLCGNAVFWICADLVLTSTWETDLSCVCVCVPIICDLPRIWASVSPRIACLHLWCIPCFVPWFMLFYSLPMHTHTNNYLKCFDSLTKKCEYILTICWLVFQFVDFQSVYLSFWFVVLSCCSHVSICQVGSSFCSPT